MKLRKIKCLILCVAAAIGVLFTGCSDNSVKGGNVDEVTLQKGDLIAEFEIEGYGTIKAKLFPDAAPVGVENFQKLCDSGFYEGLKIHRVMTGFMFQGGSTNGDGTGGDAMVNGGSFGVETQDNMRHFYGALCYANAGGQNSTQFYIVNNKEKDAYKTDLEYFKTTVDQYDELIKQAKEQGFDEAVISYYNQGKQEIQALIDKYEAFPKNIKEKYDAGGGVPQLDGDYTVFGQVYEGLDIVDEISAVEVTDNGQKEKSKPVEDIIIKSVKVTVLDEV